jgi:predicted DNA-binding protein (MmcQ/YjbR family)
MTWPDLLEHCLAKPGAWQDEPWEGKKHRPAGV